MFKNYFKDTSMIDRACISLGELCNLKCSYCHFQNEENGKLSGLNQEFNGNEMIAIANNIYLFLKLVLLEQVKHYCNLKKSVR